MEPATEAPAERTLEDTVLIQDEINLNEFGMKPFVELSFLALLLLLFWFFLIIEIELL